MTRGKKYLGKLCSLHPELDGLRFQSSYICTACVTIRARKWRAENPERNRNNVLVRKFGITYDQFQARLKSQGNCCAVCFGTVPGGSGDWHADHNHETKRIRGILCSFCNTGLGMLRENTQTLRSAIAYLEKDADGR